MDQETFFDAICVITLARRPDRFAAFLEQWKTSGFARPDVVRIGVDGEICRPPAWWTAGNGAWGCYRSHLLAIEKALNERRRNVLIFEDDAELCEGFSEQLGHVLSELPNDWDMLYFGGQHTHENEERPTKISEHIARAYSVNRNHAYAINGKAMETVYHHLNEVQNWEKTQHIDHHLEKLHRSGCINVYCAIPFIVGQAAGKSDINGKTLPERNWNIAGIFKEAKQVDGITIESLKVGWGQSKTDGSLGYQGELKPPKGVEKGTIISAHAPSILKITLSEPRHVIAFQNCDMSAPTGSDVVIDGTILGKVAKAGDCVEHELSSGAHTLEFRSSDNRACHTCWAFLEQSQIESDEPQKETTVAKPRKRKAKNE